MNCKNCGAVLSPNSTICSMCGTEVMKEEEAKPAVLELHENEVNVTPNVAPQNNIPSQMQESNIENVETPIVQINEPIVQAPVQNIDNSVPVVTNIEPQDSINNVETSKKKSDTLFYVLLGVLSFGIVASVIYLLFFIK